MQLHNLKRKVSNIKSRLVGRGGKRGKTSGRGGKGQTARAGHKVRPEIRDFIKRLPKLRGRGVSSLKSFAAKAFPVNLDVLEAVFASGDTVNPETLASKGVYGARKGSAPRVKILAGGELSKKLTVAGCEVSAEARAKIEKAGGKVEAKG